MPRKEAINVAGDQVDINLPDIFGCQQRHVNWQSSSDKNRGMASLYDQ
jgi:hypothetical protein